MIDRGYLSWEPFGRVKRRMNKSLDLGFGRWEMGLFVGSFMVFLLLHVHM